MGNRLILIKIILRSSYKILNKEGLFFVTSTIVNWIPVFKSRHYYQILIDAIKYNQINKNLKLYCYVLLPEHFHLILTGDNLTNIFKSIKGFTAKEIINLLIGEKNLKTLDKFREYKKEFKTKSEYQVWQESFHPQEVLTDKIFQQKIDYIHLNPVRKGLVSNPEDWIYSSAGFFANGNDGVLHLNGFD